ncbi:cytochrome c [Archangium lipolyticum]|uniref:cytochrome c n=1 Tax=Archangium lipolyticum TaxID=2970465 RepID=UPI002149C726|nr:cytochrome c [Archangium lipolyticum]
MNRPFLLLPLLLALPASAGDADFGKKAFEAACAQCHVAEPARPDGKNAAPANLSLWLSTHSGTELRKWVKDPWKVRADTQCDPRQLQPQYVSDLISYLRSAQTPATPATPAPSSRTPAKRN